MLKRMLLTVVIVYACSIADDFTPWLHSASVYVNTTAEWANFSGTVNNFPVLIRLDSTTFNFDEASPGGADVRFAKEDASTPIPFEIEYWDDNTKKAALWVKMDTIAGNTDKKIKMYWGNSSVSSASAPGEVFDTANSYVGVWHLSDAADSDTNKDATANSAHGIKSPSADSTPIVETPLGTGQSFNVGEGHYNHTAIPKGTINLEDKSITVSAWIKRNGLYPGDFFIAQGTQDPLIGLRFGFNYMNRFTFNFLEGDDKDLFTGPTETLDWHFWVGTFNLSDKKMSIYIDGLLDTSKVVTDSYKGNDSTHFGWAYGPSGEYFHAAGLMDEVRISTIARSAEWVALEYVNQKQNQLLVSNPVEDGAATEFGVDQAVVSATEGDTVTLKGTAKGALHFLWARVEGTVEIPLISQGTILQFATRVMGTSTLQYRFKAFFETGWQSQDVDVTITEAIPEPEFTLNLPDEFNAGIDPSDPLTVYPDITNRAEIEASSAPHITFTWNTSGTAEHFTMKRNDSLFVFFTGEGQLIVELSLDNGCPPITKRDTLDVVTPIRHAIQISGKELVALREFTNCVQVKVHDKSDYTIDIFALSGKKVISRKIQGPGTCSLPLPRLSHGVYLVQVRSKKIRFIRRIMSQ